MGGGGEGGWGVGWHPASYKVRMVFPTNLDYLNRFVFELSYPIDISNGLNFGFVR